MAWDYSTIGDFDAWIASLDQTERNETAALLDALTRLGPSLGRPHADVLDGSRYPNMKELRGKTPAAVLRIAFAFDPERVALVLCGGNEGGVSQKSFYKRLIGKADKLYGLHLEGLANERKKTQRTKKGREFMAKSHADFLNKFIPKDQRAAVKRRSDAIVIGQVLRMMREKQKLSQAEIAQRMGLKQPAIARLERQSDVKLSTLQEWAAATGGELVLAVRRQGKTSELVA
jgi:DNA-binding XRE family transcriptional regulator